MTLPNDDVLDSGRERLFREPLARTEDGFLVARSAGPSTGGLAQRSNDLRLTATLYERVWRPRSLGVLTSGGYDTSRELETMLAWTSPRSGDVWLDAGCSSGLYARTLAARPGVRAHAVDRSAAFLREGVRRADGLDVTFLRADVAALPHADGVLAGVVCGGTPNELRDLPAALAEFARVTRPGGRLWLMYVRRSGGRAGRALQATLRLAGLRFPASADVARAAQEHGWRPLRAEYRGPIALSVFERVDDPSSPP